MADQHIDVDIPVVLRGSVGLLLKKFEDMLNGKGFATQRRNKNDDGNHITDWWLYVVLNNKAPTRSRVVYGETIYQGVNVVPHLWSRAKEGYREDANTLLKHFMNVESQVAIATSISPPSPAIPPPPVRPPPRLVAIRSFDGDAWKRACQTSDDYLTLAVDDVLCGLHPPAKSEAWAYGCVGERRGWYPPEFVQVL